MKVSSRSRCAPRLVHHLQLNAPSPRELLIVRRGGISGEDHLAGQLLQQPRQIEVIGLFVVKPIAPVRTARRVQIRWMDVQHDVYQTSAVAATSSHGRESGGSPRFRRARAINTAPPSSAQRMTVAQAQMGDGGEEDFIAVATPKCCQRKVRGQLCEDQLPGVQGDLGVDEKSAPRCRIRRSNRYQIK